LNRWLAANKHSSCHAKNEFSRQHLRSAIYDLRGVNQKNALQSSIINLKIVNSNGLAGIPAMFSKPHPMRTAFGSSTRRAGH